MPLALFGPDPMSDQPILLKSIQGNLLRGKILDFYRADENACLDALFPAVRFDKKDISAIGDCARQLIAALRAEHRGKAGVEAFLQAYQLTTEEGIALMCLAEALLRIPDAKTRDALIRDKVGPGQWSNPGSDSLFVNASAWGLMLTGRVVKLGQGSGGPLIGALGSAVKRLGEPVIRAAMAQVMRIMGQQFVMGQTIEEALSRSQKGDYARSRYSFDMLGESAKTAEDAARYFDSYLSAIKKVGAAAKAKGPIASPGISVKLSALYPRYEFHNQEKSITVLAEKLLQLAVEAKRHDIGLCVDAEESERLDMSFDILQKTMLSGELTGWAGLGLALQAYQKRAFYAVDWLAELSQRAKRPIMLRLVKGAYWDSEIKRAQERGLSNYPVFTRKSSTDVSYLACAQKILDCGDKVFYPQFGTHNAHTLASILHMAGKRDFEFQRLHGMAEELYSAVLSLYNKPCRVYAPVGTHQDLLAYLVRRLLENGANSSFVHRITDPAVSVDDLIEDPVRQTAQWADKKHPKIPLPKDLFGGERKNAQGADLTHPGIIGGIMQSVQLYHNQPIETCPILGGRKIKSGTKVEIRNPADRDMIVGHVYESVLQDVGDALHIAAKAFPKWDGVGIEKRSQCLLDMADRLEQKRDEVLSLLVREAGKTMNDAVAEWREAVDFCRYYATRAETDFAPCPLPGPTGESNHLLLAGRGVFACISPWNFPLAIFLGQVAAALVSGNCVIAKPAEQTPLIAGMAVDMLHQCGIPHDVLHFLPGRGEVIGAALTSSPLVDGVAFTGGTETAQAINISLAQRRGAIPVLIAETGGQNAMIADSSALPEQVVQDVVTSSFQSAGQRCSALRVLYLQEEVADKILHMLIGAAKELKIGDPARIDTDIGPLIDSAAVEPLSGHLARYKQAGKLLFQAELGEDCGKGSFFAPAILEIGSILELEKEFFGPVLHIVRYRAEDLSKIASDINQSGYGLTFGVHTRIQETANFLSQKIRAGNIYINRNMIGAVVGVQPFGGMGLSGTGPKAGGPHYLHRFAVEKTVTADITASGGNTTLLSLSE